MSPNQDDSTSADQWHLVAYIMGGSPVSDRAVTALRRLCEVRLKDRHTIEVIDILDASSDMPQDILAVPTVVRMVPAPSRRVIGDLTRTDKVVAGLGLPDVEAVRIGGSGDER